MFSDVNLSTLYATGICHDCKLVLSVDEMDQIEASGKADDLTTTTELINLVRNHVWLEVCHVSIFTLYMPHVFSIERLKSRVDV